MTNTETTKTMEEKARDARDTVADTLESAADTVRSAADTVRSAADDGVHRINDLANQAGKKLDSTASCVRGWAGSNWFGGLRKKVNRNPIRCLAVAAAVGLIAGVSWKTSR